MVSREILKLLAVLCLQMLAGPALASGIERNVKARRTVCVFSQGFSFLDAHSLLAAILTSFNRNFKARNDGNRQTMNFLASPDIVTAMVRKFDRFLMSFADRVPLGLLWQA